jgi:DNA-binding NarL/FixJ family response regulator
MTKYETNVEVLKSYTPDQWDRLLTKVNRSKGPHRIIVVPEQRVIKVGTPYTPEEKAARRARVAELTELGWSNQRIGHEFGVSISAVSKIRKGER